MTVMKLLIMCFQVFTRENKAIQCAGAKMTFRLSVHVFDMYNRRISRGICESFISADGNLRLVKFSGVVSVASNLVIGIQWAEHCVQS